MMEEHFEKLEQLCVFKCTPEEKKFILKNLPSMIAHVEKIEHLQGVGLKTPVHFSSDSFYEDLEEKQLSVADILQNAPSFEEDQIIIFPTTHY